MKWATSAAFTAYIQLQAVIQSPLSAACLMTKVQGSSLPSRYSCPSVFAPAFFQGRLRWQPTESGDGISHTESTLNAPLTFYCTISGCREVVSDTLDTVCSYLHGVFATRDTWASHRVKGVHTCPFPRCSYTAAAGGASGQGLGRWCALEAWKVLIRTF